MASDLTKETMEWEVRLGDAAPHRRFPVILVACLASVVGFLMLASPVIAVIAPFVILASTAELFLPIKYRIDPEKVSSKCGPSVTEMQWADVKRVIELEGAIRLSPFAKPNRLDNFRGVLLRFSGNETEVWAKLRELWINDESILGTGTHSRAGDGTDQQAREGDQETKDGGTGYSRA